MEQNSDVKKTEKETRRQRGSEGMCRLSREAGTSGRDNRTEASFQ
jgi:hypothetical protein